MPSPHTPRATQHQSRPLPFLPGWSSFLYRYRGPSRGSLRRLVAARAVHARDSVAIPIICDRQHCGGRSGRHWGRVRQRVSACVGSERLQRCADGGYGVGPTRRYADIDASSTPAIAAAVTGAAAAAAATATVATASVLLQILLLLLLLPVKSITLCSVRLMTLVLLIAIVPDHERACLC